MGVAVSEDGAEQGSMGVAVGDYDHSGRFSLFVTNFAEEYNALYRNDGSHFTDVSFRSKTARGQPAVRRLGQRVLRLRQRRLLDLIVVNGHVYPQLDKARLRRVGGLPAAQAALPQPRQRHVRGGRRPRYGPTITEERVSRGLAVGDLDNDGRLDVVDQRSRRSAAGPAQRAGEASGNWLLVRLKGSGQNTSAIGAVVTREGGTPSHAAAARAERHQLHLAGRHAAALRSRRGDAVEALEVLWPDGTKTSLANVKANQILDVQQPAQVTPISAAASCSRTRCLGLAIASSRAPQSGASVARLEATISGGAGRMRADDPAHAFDDRLGAWATRAPPSTTIDGSNRLLTLAVAMPRKVTQIRGRLARRGVARSAAAKRSAAHRAVGCVLRLPPLPQRSAVPPASRDSRASRSPMSTYCGPMHIRPISPARKRWPWCSWSSMRIPAPMPVPNGEEGAGRVAAGGALPVLAEDGEVDVVLDDDRGADRGAQDRRHRHFVPAAPGWAPAPRPCRAPESTAPGAPAPTASTLATGTSMSRSRSSSWLARPSRSRSGASSRAVSTVRRASSSPLQIGDAEMRFGLNRGRSRRRSRVGR